MTPQEAAERVITCTATGQSGLPLWQYLPGMFVHTYAFTEGDSLYASPGRVVAVNVLRGSIYLSICTINGDLMQTRAEWMRPDFTDELTVQALYLLVRRAYAEADGLIDLREWGDGTVRLRISGDVYEGSDYAVFARALAKAPVRS